MNKHGRVPVFQQNRERARSNFFQILGVPDPACVVPQIRNFFTRLTRQKRGTLEQNAQLHDIYGKKLFQYL
jgi:hypothetical protein